jgi:lipid-A-disaccharide synthase
MTHNENPQILIVAGEASGDIHGAELVSSIKKLKEIHFFGIGGESMKKAGVEILQDIKDMAVMGLFAVLGKLPQILGVLKLMKEQAKSRKPDLAILIDYPDFNLRFARYLNKIGIPIVYFISPQVWAWRKGRVKLILRIIKKLLVIFPFEVDFYKKNGVDATYVGNPLCQLVKEGIEKDPAKRKDYGFNDKGKLFGFLPGSRKSEINYHLKTILETAKLLKEKYPNAQFGIVKASTFDRDIFEPYIINSDLGIKIIEENRHGFMRLCDFIITSSGTATLETALVGTPMAVVYKCSYPTYFIGRLVISVPNIAMANLVAGKEIVPEFIQNQFKPKPLADKIIDILESPEKYDNMKLELSKIRKKLGDEIAADKAAKIIMDLIDQSSNI